nr:hypothetical protein [Tanacetum cinerariifolium]
MDNKKHIVNLETFRDMLHICPRILGQSFDELPFEEGIMDFLRFLGHSAQIRTLTDVNINKLFQLWRSFRAVINKCLTGKSSGFDNFRLSQAQILWGLYHRRNIDYAFLIWEDFMYQVKHKNHKKSNEMYYPRFTKVISRHQNTQQYGAMLPIQLTNEDIRNTKAYKEYYACTTREAIPKPKASARKKRSGSDTSITPPTTITTSTTTKKNSHGTLRMMKTLKLKKRMVMTMKEMREIDEQDDTERGGDNDEEMMIKKVKVMRRVMVMKQGKRRVLIQSLEPLKTQESSSVSSQFVTSVLNPTSDAGMQSIFMTASSLVAPLQTSTTIMTPSTIATITTISHAPIPPTTIPSEVLQNLPTFDSVFRFKDRLKSLEADFLEYIQTNPFAKAVSNILADFLEMELKKILIEKIEGNKSIQRSDEQRNLYKALVKAYEADKIILDTYGETVTLKRRRNDEFDKDEGPFAGSDRGSKRRREGKEPESASAPLQTATRRASRLPVRWTNPHIQYHDWNKTLPAVQGSTQTWISELAKQADSCSSFNELLDTPLDFSNFIMHQLTVDTLTPKLLDGPTYELMKGSCQQYPHNLLQPLPLIPNNRGRRVIPFAHFINNDLEYLRGGGSSHKYTTSEPINYDKHAFWGVSYWGRKRQQFYGFTVNRESALDVYSKRRIIAVTDLKIVEWHSYKHLDWITVRRNDDKLYKFKEGDFNRLRLQDIEDMLLLLVQGKLFNLTIEE